MDMLGPSVDGEMNYWQVEPITVLLGSHGNSMKEPPLLEDLMKASLGVSAAIQRLATGQLVACSLLLGGDESKARC